MWPVFDAATAVAPVIIFLTTRFYQTLRCCWTSNLNGADIFVAFSRAALLSDDALLQANLDLGDGGLRHTQTSIFQRLRPLDSGVRLLPARTLTLTAVRGSIDILLAGLLAELYARHSMVPDESLQVVAMK